MVDQRADVRETLLPLVIDLDGTLVRTDLLAETALLYLRHSRGALLHIPRWLAKGKAHLKSNLAAATEVRVEDLPYERRVIEFIETARAKGRRVVLATASHRRLAEAVAAHLGLFDDVLATGDDVNLSGNTKRDALTDAYGHGRFDYVGNGTADLPIIAAANAGYLVRPTARVLRSAQRENPNTELLVPADTTPRDWLRAIRLHQWAKNLLLFLPLLAAHRIEPLIGIQALGAFLIFGLAASSVYLLNDLLDLPDDRAHPLKRRRPIASGRVTLLQATVLTPALLLLALAGAWLLFPPTFLAVLAAYYAVTLAYSLHLKRKAMVDVLTLGLLYTFRIVAGAAALAIPLTAWMLAFSLFVFLSLALIKRCAELLASPDLPERSTLAGRGYRTSDLPLLQSFGAASGYLSVLVLALYIQDPATASLYGRPAIIWLAVPIWLYWISRAWLITHRGDMHDDPVLFAIKDGTSYLVGLALAITFLAAA